MYQYTNGFICAIEKSKNEVIIKFLQRFPDMYSSEDEEEIESIEVANVIMKKDAALKLSNSIKELCEENIEEE